MLIYVTYFIYNILLKGSSNDFKDRESSFGNKQSEVCFIWGLNLCVFIFIMMY